MAEIKCHIENLLQDDRITDEEWLALGKALNIENILHKNKNSKIYSIKCAYYYLLQYDKITDKELLELNKILYEQLRIKNTLDQIKKDRINFMSLFNFNFSGLIGEILNSSFSYETSIWQMPPSEEEINKVFEDKIKILENKFYLTEEEKSICYVATKFFNKQNVAKNFLNELVELKNDYEKIKNLASEVSKIYKRNSFHVAWAVHQPTSLKEILFGDKNKLEKEKMLSSIFSANLIIVMIKKRLIISEFFKEIDDGKIDNNI